MSNKIPSDCGNYPDEENEDIPSLLKVAIFLGKLAVITGLAGLIYTAIDICINGLG